MESDETALLECLRKRCQPIGDQDAAVVGAGDIIEEFLLRTVRGRSAPRGRAVLALKDCGVPLMSAASRSAARRHPSTW
ncbi:hypothetical protein [Microvirga sp. VF16]|uniref:hypothetical protein n=1 Tax=Microvirga sp. VF16 TaxID=2807101 RepID=UPI00193DC0D1|nr:hypothetical protein [Microvirga sp. VF16]QRM34456.1 hypothetical protein JO965_35275 [Microvirga sp. VF16]